MKANIKKNKSSVLKEPRVTEKATRLQGSNVYTFNVPKSVTKPEIAKAIKELYKVIPVKIRTVNIPSENVFIRGQRGVKSGGKKAYIYLKKENKIEIK